FCTGFDLSKVVVFLFSSKASLQAACPFLSDGLGQLLSLFLVFSCPSLFLEVGTYIIFGGKIPVLVGSVYRICPGQLGLGHGKALCFEDGVGKAVALMESIKAKVFYKADPVHLVFVHLGTKLYRFGFLAPYNRADILFVQADDTVFGLLTK